MGVSKLGRIQVNIDLDEIVNELAMFDKDRIFEIITALEIKCADTDFLEKCYLHFKEQYEEEMKHEHNKSS